MGPYDVVVVSEVLEKIPSPKALLGERCARCARRECCLRGSRHGCSV